MATKLKWTLNSVSLIIIIHFADPITLRFSQMTISTPCHWLLLSPSLTYLRSISFLGTGRWCWPLTLKVRAPSSPQVRILTVRPAACSSSSPSHSALRDEVCLNIRPPTCWETLPRRHTQSPEPNEQPHLESSVRTTDFTMAVATTHRWSCSSLL